MLRNSDCYHWAGIAGALAISSLTFRKGNNQLIRAIKVDGDLVEVQNQFPYSLSLQDVVLSKGLPCPFCSVLSAQAQDFFCKVSLWLSVETECYHFMTTRLLEF